jgi:small subunit ribosomal protein S9
MSTATYHRGTGRRKCAIAQVRLSSGSGNIIINGKPYQELFPLVDHRRMIEQAFVVTRYLGKI